MVGIFRDLPTGDRAAARAPYAALWGSRMLGTSRDLVTVARAAARASCRGLGRGSLAAYRRVGPEFPASGVSPVSVEEFAIATDAPESSIDRRCLGPTVSTVSWRAIAFVYVRVTRATASNVSAAGPRLPPDSRQSCQWA
jgi:hypothetical protein